VRSKTVKGGFSLGRPRTFDAGKVVEAAKDTFWQHGYEGTAVGDLERATGLHRSSLYLAFGTKQSLFEQALGSYLDGFISPRLRPMERPEAGLADIVDFLGGLADWFRGGGPRSRRGCLMINSIAELVGRAGPSGQGPEEFHDRWAVRFRDRLSGALASALAGAAARGEVEPSRVDPRARFLTATVLGVWLAARIDPLDAAATCDAVLAEVTAWRQPVASPRS
jgi:TetR/AcrR family transcriptional repressor of nem operon